MVREEVEMMHLYLNVNWKRKHWFVVVQHLMNLPFLVPVAAWSAFDIPSKPVAKVVEWRPNNFAVADAREHFDHEEGPQYLASS